MSDLMKAIRIHQYGGTEVLKYEAASRPEPATNEVLVKVHAAGINPVDWNTRAGRGMSFKYQDSFPLILGWDISGVVESIGAQVSRFKPGDEVFSMVRFPEIGSAYAEYVSVPEEELAKKPSNFSHIDAAAVPLAALTAWQAFFEAGNLTSGQRLLIQGASGGVGHLAVQIARWKGAYVIGTASTGNIEFLQSLGVDEVVDYSKVQFEDVVEPVDMVLSTIPSEIMNRSLDVIKLGGSLVSIAGAPDQEKAKQQGVNATNILVHTHESHLNQIAEIMEAGQLKPDIAQVFPLAQAAQAHELGANRTLRRGKIVLQVI